MKNTLALRGRCALVTGASKGIGRAIAAALQQSGAVVHLLARSESSLRQAAAGMEEQHKTGNGDDAGIKQSAPVIHVCDVSDHLAVERLVKDLEHDGVIPDILVNNAGMFRIASVAETSSDLFRKTLNTNLAGPFQLVRAFLPEMLDAGNGDIVTIGSVADRRIFPGNGAYAASQFGARALHEVLRAELAGSGVRCSLVSPAQTNTSLWDNSGSADAGAPDRAAMLRADDVAEAVLWILTRARDVNIDELRLSRS